MKKAITILLALYTCALCAEIRVVSVSQIEDGQCSGSFEMMASGSAGPFEIILRNGNSILERIRDVNGTHTFENLCVGVYGIEIINRHEMCPIYREAEVIDCSNSGLRIVYNPVFDPNGNDFGTFGDIQISAYGGTGFYTFSWEGPNGFTSTEEDLINVPPGVYTVTVTDELGCRHTEEINSSCGQLIITGWYDRYCNEADLGGVTVMLHGVTNYDLYSFVWDDGVTGRTRHDLQAGKHTVMVTDFENCEYTRTFSVIPEFFFQLPDQKICNEDHVELRPLNITGTPPFSYQWSNGSQSDNIHVYPGEGGLYTLTITDANNCKSVEYCTVTEGVITFETQWQDRHCREVTLCDGEPIEWTSRAKLQFDQWAYPCNELFIDCYARVLCPLTNETKHRRAKRTCCSNIQMDSPCGNGCRVKCRWGQGLFDGLDKEVMVISTPMCNSCKNCPEVNINIGAIFNGDDFGPNCEKCYCFKSEKYSYTTTGGNTYIGVRNIYRGYWCTSKCARRKNHFCGDDPPFKNLSIKSKYSQSGTSNRSANNGDSLIQRFYLTGRPNGRSAFLGAIDESYNMFYDTNYDTLNSAQSWGTVVRLNDETREMLFAGIFSSGGEQLKYLKSSGGSDMYIKVLDEYGDALMERSIGSKGDDYLIDGEWAVNQSDLVITGTFNAEIEELGIHSHDQSRDVLLTKLTSSGVVLWAHSFGSAYDDQVIEVEVDADDNIYVLGIYVEDLVLEDQTIVSSEGMPRKLYLTKYNGNGVREWSITGASFYDDISRVDMVAADDGHINLIVEHEGHMMYYLPSGSHEIPGVIGKQNIDFLHFNSDGEVMASSQILIDTGHFALINIGLLDTNKVVIGGNLDGRLSVNDQNTIVSDENGDITLLTLDIQTGALVDYDTLGGSYDVELSDMDVHTEGFVDLAGHYNGTLELGDLVYEATDNDTARQIFVYSMEKANNGSASFFAPDPQPNVGSISVYPNPTSAKKINLSFINHTDSEDGQIEIYNTLGKRMLIRPWSLSYGYNATSLDGSQRMKFGEAYIIRIVVGGSAVYSTKVLIL